MARGVSINGTEIRNNLHIRTLFGSAGCNKGDVCKVTVVTYMVVQLIAAVEESSASEPCVARAWTISAGAIA